MLGRTGVRVSAIGVGTWQLSGADAREASRHALEIGYRQIDTAQAYGNEESVGRALRASDVPRDEIFLATKFYPRARSRDPRAEAERSLERLGVEQVDLYLIHWPEDGRGRRHLLVGAEKRGQVEASGAVGDRTIRTVIRTR